MNIENKQNQHSKRNCKPHYHNPALKKSAFGAVFIFAGLALLGFNTGLFPEQYRWVVFSWQSLLIVIGFINIVGNFHYIGGSIVILIGSYFMVQDYGNLNLRLFDWVLPILLILLGFMFITRRFHAIRHYRHRERIEKDINLGIMNDYNIFNGSKQKIVNDNFKGGSSTNIFGGCELDFSNSQLADGDNFLDVTCIFGGMTLKVPEDWNIEFRVNPLFGGINDKRYTVQGMTYDSNKKLIISGTLVFGGMEIE